MKKRLWVIGAGKAEGRAIHGSSSKKGEKKGEWEKIDKEWE